MPCEYFPERSYPLRVRRQRLLQPDRQYQYHLNYSVSPYIARRFKDTAELKLRYTWDDQFNSADIVEDSIRQSAEALLSSVPGVSKFSWGLQGDYSQVSYADTFGQGSQ